MQLHSFRAGQGRNLHCLTGYANPDVNRHLLSNLATSLYKYYYMLSHLRRKKHVENEEPLGRGSLSTAVGKPKYEMPGPTVACLEEWNPPVRGIASNWLT